MSSLLFLFYEAWVNLRRHGLMTVAAITTMAVSLTLIGSFLLTFYQVNIAAKRAVGDFEMRVFCREQVTRKQLGGIKKRIKELPGVGSVTYISKETAFKEQVKNLPIDTTGLPNKFNETFVIKMSDPARENAIASEIRGWHDLIEEVSVPESEMQGVQRIASFLRTVGVVGGLVLLFGALIVVSNTIRISLFARRREIKIMQIVGATPWFIRLPLFLEGLIHGVLGGLVAGLCLFFTEKYVRALTEQVAPMLAHYFEPVDMLTFGGAVIVVGTLIGAIGSLLSMRRYLRAL